jgi:hypothetical protein
MVGRESMIGGQLRIQFQTLAIGRPFLRSTIITGALNE